MSNTTVLWTNPLFYHPLPSNGKNLNIPLPFSNNYKNLPPVNRFNGGGGGGGNYALLFSKEVLCDSTTIFNIQKVCFGFQTAGNYQPRVVEKAVYNFLPL